MYRIVIIAEFGRQIAVFRISPKKSLPEIFLLFFFASSDEHLCYCLLIVDSVLSLVEQMNIMELSLVASYDELRRCQDVLTDGTAEVGECERQRVNISFSFLIRF